MGSSVYEICRACGEVVLCDVSYGEGVALYRCPQCHRTIYVLYDEDGEVEDE